MRYEFFYDFLFIIFEVLVFVNIVFDLIDYNFEFKDDVFNYYCGFMNMFLLFRNFMDVIKEGDGERIIRCIKMFFLYFKVDGGGSIKYVLEVLYYFF